MIAVSLKGGLGNQLYQYASAKALARQNKSVIWLDVSFFNSKIVDLTPRHFELNSYKLIERKDVKIIGTMDSVITKFDSKNLAIRGVKKLLPKYIEQSPDFDQSFFDNKGHLVIEGYFQSYKYFKHLKQELIKDFELLESLNEDNKGMLKAILNKNSVCIHVRRGDYVTLKSASEFHGLCDINYYNQAIELIESKVNDPYYFIFSDDIAWCQENFNNNSATFVDINSTKKAHLDMYLMQNCKYFIIANSTFSWWGAWLSSYDDKIVISPKNWFINENINIEDRIPQEWIRI